VTVGPATETKPPEVPSKLFSEVLALYLREVKWAPRTRYQFDAGLRNFVDIIGGDLPIRSIQKRPHCLQYKEALVSLPRHWATKYQGKTMADVLSNLRKGEYERPR
jgi:hypothetical protein